MTDRTSPEASRLALAGDIDGAQAVAFIDHAIDYADELSAIRFQWLRKFVLERLALTALETALHAAAAELDDRDARVPADRRVPRDPPRDGVRGEPAIWSWIRVYDPLDHELWQPPRPYYLVDRNRAGAAPLAERLPLVVSANDFACMEPMWRGLYRPEKHLSGVVQWELRPEYRSHWGRPA